MSAAGRYETAPRGRSDEPSRDETTSISAYTQLERGPRSPWLLFPLELLAGACEGVPSLGARGSCPSCNALVPGFSATLGFVNLPTGKLGPLRPFAPRRLVRSASGVSRDAPVAPAADRSDPPSTKHLGTILHPVVARLPQRFAQQSQPPIQERYVGGPSGPTLPVLDSYALVKACWTVRGPSSDRASFVRSDEFWREGRGDGGQSKERLAFPLASCRGRVTSANSQGSAARRR